MTSCVVSVSWSLLWGRERTRGFLCDGHSTDAESVTPIIPAPKGADRERSFLYWSYFGENVTCRNFPLPYQWRLKCDLQRSVNKNHCFHYQRPHILFALSKVGHHLSYSPPFSDGFLVRWSKFTSSYGESATERKKRRYFWKKKVSSQLGIMNIYEIERPARSITVWPLWTEVRPTTQEWSSHVDGN